MKDEYGSKFKIPMLLDTSYLDLEFTFRTKDGLSLRPLSAKTVLIILASIILWAFLMFQSFIPSGGVIAVIVFTLAWIFITTMMAKTDQTKRSGIELVIPLINYVPKHNRNLTVRLVDDVARLQNLTKVKDVTEEDAMIYFMDGTIGFAYRIVGSASILMFDQDKLMILNKVDGFYRKLDSNVELIFDTVKESQRTDVQVDSLKKRYKRYKQVGANSPGLDKLFREQYDVLKIGVGDRFKSLHQYLIVKANNPEALLSFEALLRSDVENEGIMFKRAEALSYDDTCEYFKSIYGE